MYGLRTSKKGQSPTRTSDLEKKVQFHQPRKLIPATSLKSWDRNWRNNPLRKIMRQGPSEKDRDSDDKTARVRQKGTTTRCSGDRHQLNELISEPDNQDSGTANKRIRRPTRYRPMKRDPTQFGRNTDTVRNEGPDSTLNYWDCRRRTDSTLTMRPSKKNGLTPILWDRQWRTDSRLTTGPSEEGPELGL